LNTYINVPRDDFRLPFGGFRHFGGFGGVLAGGLLVGLAPGALLGGFGCVQGIWWLPVLEEVDG
jgi:predicted lipid-binding transport protein (Tim44 family)